VRKKKGQGKVKGEKPNTKPCHGCQANIHVAPTDTTHPYHVHLFARDKQQVQDNGMVPGHAIALWYRMLVAWVASFYNKACCLVSAPKTAHNKWGKVLATRDAMGNLTEPGG